MLNELVSFKTKCDREGIHVAITWLDRDGRVEEVEGSMLNEQ